MFLHYSTLLILICHRIQQEINAATLAISSMEPFGLVEVPKQVLRVLRGELQMVLFCATLGMVLLL